MLEIKSTITGERLEVAKNDFETEMLWEQAKSACNDLGNGWRLPSKSELEQMYKELHQSGKGNFKSWFYWSITETDDGYVWNINFANGDAYDGSKTIPSNVRAVRSI